MKKIILGLMIFFSTSLFATDVSNFDIKGLKLGMNEKEALNILNNQIKCKKVKFDNIHADLDYNYPIIGKHYYCYIDNSIEIDFFLDHDMKVYRVTRVLKPKIEPNWKKLKTNILNHYGRTKFIYENTHKTNMCWGSCKFYKFNHSYINDSHQSLSIDLFYPGDNRYNRIDFYLIDKDLEKSNQQYEKILLKRIKDNASNIDF
jgi:hypothetical protein